MKHILSSSSNATTSCSLLNLYPSVYFPTKLSGDKTQKHANFFIFFFKYTPLYKQVHPQEEEEDGMLRCECSWECEGVKQRRCFSGISDGDKEGKKPWVKNTSGCVGATQRSVRNSRMQVYVAYRVSRYMHMERKRREGRTGWWHRKQVTLVTLRPHTFGRTDRQDARTEVREADPSDRTDEDDASFFSSYDTKITGNVREDGPTHSRHPSCAAYYIYITWNL